MKVTFQPTLRPETSHSNLERALERGAISVRDMALRTVATFNTFDTMGSGYIGTRK
jgi:hypothetical protein